MTKAANDLDSLRIRLGCTQAMGTNVLNVRGMRINWILTRTLRTFARKFSNIDFFLKILPLKDDELVMPEILKNGGVTDFVLERTCLEERLNLSKLGFFSEEGHSGCKSQNIAITALKGSVPCQIWFK